MGGAGGPTGVWVGVAVGVDVTVLQTFTRFFGT